MTFLDIFGWVFIAMLIVLIVGGYLLDRDMKQ